MSKNKNAPAGQDSERSQSDIDADRAMLVAKAHRSASKIPYMLTKEAKHAAISECISTWLQVLRGSVAGQAV